MCGIVGIHGEQDASWISAMNSLIEHRGPDDFGVFKSTPDQLSLGMRRLAIVDIKGGRQPMTTQDGRYTIVFNGEIFNAPDLREDLINRGVKFKSDHSDTEIILQGYVLDGALILPKLNGMFAFVIYDDLEKSLFCARDRFGIKPLYYFIDGKHFAFSSELKSLLILPFINQSLNIESVYHFSSLMFVPGPATIFNSIKKLQPAHSLKYGLKTGKIDINRWWRVKFGRKKISAAEASERVRSALENAVERWSLSDVPTACSLSGGIDSSVIAVLLAQRTRNLKTFSVGFTGPGEEKWNELPLAREVANRIGSDHKEIVIDPESLIGDLPKMVWHLDEPYGGGLPSWAVFKYMSKEVKVGFTGTGGDEIFGDYLRWRHYEKRLIPAISGRSRFNRQFFNRHYYLSDVEKQQNVFNRGDISSLRTSNMLFSLLSEENAPTARDKITRMDMETQLSDEFLLMTDRLSMAHSLEARTPFLDHEFVEEVFSLQAHIRTAFRPYKSLLRHAVSTLLPKTLLEAPKKGFTLPLKLWIRGPLREMVEELLSPQRLKQQGIYRTDLYNRFVLPHLQNKADNTNLLWGALMFQLWYQSYLECPPQSLSTIKNLV